ncbi:MAG: DUF4126 domain-containing protein [Steroidobacteraceae bacterium]
MSELQVLYSVALGIALAAAVGLRVFLPLLALSIAAYSGHVSLSDGFAWLGTMPALAMLAIATIVEVAAYYIPGLDNALDALATPVALLAGTVAAAAVMTDLPPLIKWTTAVIAGGGVAGLTQGASSLLRAKSTLTTGGLGNSVVASGELGGALVLSVLAIVMPLVALALAVALLWLVFKLVRRLVRGARRGAN